MSKSYDITTRAVVVARLSSGEGSVRAALYTEEYGLVHAFAKSAREERSKLRSHLQVGSYGAYTVVRGKHEWKVVGAVETRNSYFELAATPELQHASSRVVGVVRHLVHGEEQNEELFSVLWSYLDALRGCDPTEARGAEMRAVARILSTLGYVSVATTELTDERELTKHINEALAASHLGIRRAV